MIEEICGICGSPIQHICYATYPPQYEDKCPKCGIIREYKDKIEQVKVFPKEKTINLNQIK